MFRLKGHHVRYGETVGHRTQFTPIKDMADLRDYLMSLVIADPKPSGAPWFLPPDKLFE